MKTRFYLQENGPKVIGTNTHYFYIGILVALWYKKILKFKGQCMAWYAISFPAGILPPRSSRSAGHKTHRIFGCFDTIAFVACVPLPLFTLVTPYRPNQLNYKQNYNCSNLEVNTAECWIFKWIRTSISFYSVEHFKFVLVEKCSL